MSVLGTHMYANIQTDTLASVRDVRCVRVRDTVSALKKLTSKILLATELAVSNAVGHVNCMAFPLLGVKLPLTAHCTLYNNPLDFPCLRVWGIAVNQIKARQNTFT